MKRPFLRDTVSNRTRWEQTVTQLRTELDDASSPRERLSVLGRLGDQLRRCENTRAESLTLLRDAVQSAIKQVEVESRIANQIRLATALQYADHHSEAIERFEKTLSLIRRSERTPLLDYALQHFGKCLVEVGEVERAVECFRRALELRRERKERVLIDSTLEALTIIQS